MNMHVLYTKESKNVHLSDWVGIRIYLFSSRMKGGMYSCGMDGGMCTGIVSDACRIPMRGHAGYKRFIHVGRDVIGGLKKLKLLAQSAKPLRHWV